MTLGINWIDASLDCEGWRAETVLYKSKGRLPTAGNSCDRGRVDGSMTSLRLHS